MMPRGKLGTYQPFDKLAKSGMDITTVVDGNGNVFLAVTSKARTTFVQIYKVFSNKLVNAGVLKVSSFSAFIQKKFISISSGRTALVTMLNGLANQQQYWSYNTTSKRFVEIVAPEITKAAGTCSTTKTSTLTLTGTGFGAISTPTVRWDTNVSLSIQSHSATSVVIKINPKKVSVKRGKHTVSIINSNWLMGSTAVTCR